MAPILATSGGNPVVLLSPPPPSILPRPPLPLFHGTRSSRQASPRPDLPPPQRAFRILTVVELDPRLVARPRLPSVLPLQTREAARDAPPRLLRRWPDVGAPSSSRPATPAPRPRGAARSRVRAPMRRRRSSSSPRRGRSRPPPPPPRRPGRPRLLPWLDPSAYTLHRLFNTNPASSRGCIHRGIDRPPLPVRFRRWAGTAAYQSVCRSLDRYARCDCRSISACIMNAAGEDDDDAEEDEDLSSSLTTMVHITRSLLPAGNYSLQVLHHSQEEKWWVFFDFDVGKALGSGNFGHVYLAREKRMLAFIHVLS